MSPFAALDPSREVFFYNWNLVKHRHTHTHKYTKTKLLIVSHDGLLQVIVQKLDITMIEMTCCSLTRLLLLDLIFLTRHHRKIRLTVNLV